MRTTLLSLTVLLIAALGISAAPAIAEDSQQSDPPSSWERFTERHDQNDDGLVSAEEFGRSDRRFQELDADGNGTVDPEEMEQLEARCGAPRTPPAPGGGLVRMADRNQDHELTREEWDALAAELDSDTDGTISDEELIQAMIRNRAARSGGHHGDPGRPTDDSKPRGSEREPRPLTGHLDSNQDGLLDSRDLDEIFADLDADGDAVVRSDEMPPFPFGPRGRRSGCDWTQGHSRRHGGPGTDSVR